MACDFPFILTSLIALETFSDRQTIIFTMRFQSIAYSRRQSSTVTMALRLLETKLINHMSSRHMTWIATKAEFRLDAQRTCTLWSTPKASR